MANRFNEAWQPYVLNILRRYPHNKHPEEDAAIERALEEADPDTAALIDLVYFRKTHSLEAASDRLYISYSTAWRRQMLFRLEVARNLNLPMDETTWKKVQ